MQTIIVPLIVSADVLLYTVHEQTICKKKDLANSRIFLNVTRGSCTLKHTLWGASIYLWGASKIPESYQFIMLVIFEYCTLKRIAKGKARTCVTEALTLNQTNLTGFMSGNTWSCIGNSCGYVSLVNYTVNVQFVKFLKEISEKEFSIILHSTQPYTVYNFRYAYVTVRATIEYVNVRWTEEK